MSEMFKITLPDGSVREMPEGSTPADVAAAIGPGLAKAALAARVDGEVRDLNRPFEGDAEPGAGHLARREGRARAGPPRLRPCAGRGGAEAVSRHPDHLRPGDRRRLLLRLRPGARTAGRSPTRICRRSRRRCAGSSPRDEPLVREVWSRERRPRLLRKAGRDVQGRMGDGAARGRADHHVPLGPWRGRLDRPVPRAAPRLDRQARSAGVQADPCVGRLLARRPEQPDAEPHLRHRLAQQEAARRASRPARGSGQARPSQDRPGDGPVPPPGRGAWQRLLAPQRLHHLAPAGGLYAPPARRRRLCRDQDPAADGRPPVGEERPLGQVSREYVRRARRDPQRSRTRRRCCRARPT